MDKFERRPPSIQNAIDIFRDKWASTFDGLLPAETGGISPHFTTDARPGYAATTLGVNGRLDGFRVLELGPLEGGHTFQLERLGASEVLAIEANAEAYVKCLIVKEALNLERAHFMLGDFTEYLESTNERFDMVFASGVLYHMTDPLGLIESIARVTDRAFVWTHYFDPVAYVGVPRTARPDPRSADITRYEAEYPDMDSGHFWGGNIPMNAWLARADILSFFQRAGFQHIRVNDEHRDHPNGACFSFSASRLPLV